MLFILVCWGEGCGGARLRHRSNREGMCAAVLLVAAFLTALLVMPSRTLADTVTIGQSDFDNAGGHLTLTTSGERTYKLSGNVEGSVEMYVTAENAKLTLDLDGHTLRCPASADSIAINILAPNDIGGFLTVTNGAVVQEADKAAIRSENVHFQPLTVLQDLSVTATNQHCVEQAGSTQTDIVGGSYTTLNTGDSNASVIYCARDIVKISGGTRITLNGGDNIVEYVPSTTEAGGIYFRGECSLSQVPDPTMFTTGGSYTFYKKAGADEYWQVVERDDDFLSRSDCNYYVNHSELWFNYYWYFEDKDEAQAFRDAYPDRFSEVYTLIFKFNFNPDNGDLPTSLTVHYGDVVSKDQFNDGNDPTYDPYVFQGWKKDGTSDYDFSSKITKSVTVNASWGAPAATVNGKGYLTLEEAVDAAYSGSTVILFRDITRTDRLNITDKGSIRLDLNGKAITYSGSGSAIVVENTALTISDSTKSEGAQINATSGCVQLNSGTLSIEGGTYNSSSVAIGVSDGSLSITGGTIQSTASDYDVRLLDNATASVGGGYLKGYVKVISDNALRVTGGSFGTNANKPSVSTGYHMLQGSDGRYSVGAHVWPNSYTYNGNGTHSRTCTADGCNETETAQCWGTMATCISGRVCYSCGATYTDPDPTNHAPASSTWNSNATKHWYTCTGCGEIYPNTEATHVFTWKVDVEPTVSTKGSEHEECSVCGYLSGNTRTIDELDGTSPVILGIIEGVAYDGVTTFTVTDPDDDLVSVVAGGRTLRPSNGDAYTLPNLNTSFEVIATDAHGHQAKVKVSSYEDHEWSEWASLGNGTHEQTCAHNGCTVVSERQNCTGGEATCSAGAHCDVCGAVYTDTNPDNHVNLGDWEHDDEAHWRTCTDCGAILDKSEHELEDASDSDYTWRECTTCGFVTDKTAKPDSGGDDKGDEDDKGGGSDDSGSEESSDSEKITPAGGTILPTTADPLTCTLGIALAGAAALTVGISRRK